MDTLLQVLDRFDALVEFTRSYSGYLYLAAILFALLNCFFGYALRKVWGVLLGFLVGALGGALAAAFTQQTLQMAVVLALGVGLIVALISLFLYRIGLFFLISGITGAVIWQIASPTDTTSAALVLIIAFVTAVTVVPLERIGVILITAIFGSVGAMQMTCHLLSWKPSLQLWGIACILAAFGALFQFKPWSRSSRSEDHKGRRRRRDADDDYDDYDDYDDEEDYDDYPRRKKHSSSSSSRKKSRSSSHSSSGRKKRVSQNTMYDFRFTPEVPDDPEEELKHFKPFESRPSEEEPDPSSAWDDTPDLSDVRAHLSDEVQQIYRDSYSK